MAKHEGRQCKTVAMHLPIEVIEKVDRLAGMADLTRSKLLANIVEVGADELMALDKIGVLRISLLLRDMRENLRAHLAERSERAVA